MNDASHDASKDLEQRQSVFEVFSTTMPKLVALLEKVQAQKDDGKPVGEVKTAVSTAFLRAAARLCFFACRDAAFLVGSEALVSVGRVKRPQIWQPPCLIVEPSSTACRRLEKARSSSGKNWTG